MLVNEMDFDTSVYVHDEAAPESFRRFRRRLQLKTAIFQFGARILGFAVQTIRNIATGIMGWARLLKSLVKSLRELKPFYEQLKAVRAEVSGG